MKKTSNKIMPLLLIAGALLFAGCAITLMQAAEKGDTKESERLIATGADVNAKDVSGLSPLHMAAVNGHKDVVELLLAKGADVNAKDGNGLNPLHTAAVNGQKDIVELLIAKGADPA